MNYNTSPLIINQALISGCNEKDYKLIDYHVIKERIHVMVKTGRKSKAKHLGLKSVRQISRITKKLVDLGILIFKGFSELGTCIYRVNPYIYKNWQSFYRQIPSLSIAFLWSSKPAPVNNVPLIRKDKGIIGAFDAKCLSPMEQFYANWVTQVDINPEIKTQEQMDYANTAFEGPNRSVLSSSSDEVRPDAAFLNIKIEGAAKETVHCSPNIFVKNEDACQWPDHSQIQDIVVSIVQRLRVDLRISNH